MIFSLWYSKVICLFYYVPDGDEAMFNIGTHYVSTPSNMSNSDSGEYPFNMSDNFVKFVGM